MNNGKANLTFDEFMLSKLGGEREAKTSYLREVVGTGPDSTLHEVFEAAERVGLVDWLEGLTMRQLAEALGLELATPSRVRRTHQELRAAIVEACRTRSMSIKEITATTGIRGTTVERHFVSLQRDGVLVQMPDDTIAMRVLPAEDVEPIPVDADHSTSGHEGPTA